MRRLVLMWTVAGLGLVVAGAVAQKEDPLAKAMRVAHDGKSSPASKLKHGLAAEQPSWADLKKDTDGLQSMSKELIKAKGDKHRAVQAYRDSVEQLVVAVEKKQKEAATTAFKKFSGTCASCHYGGMQIP